MDGKLSQSELERIKRVSDMFVTAHSVLRDRFARRAFLIDITILGATLWLTAMAFVSPSIGVELTPRGLSKDLWLGLLSVVAFFLSIVQIRVNWKGKEDAHARACAAYSSLKRECANLLSQVAIDKLEYGRILDKYESAGTLSIPIPEAEFNKLKSKHKIKVEISRHLDNHPAASPTLLKFKLWWRDNTKNDHDKK
jgi:hypothetical protein